MHVKRDKLKDKKHQIEQTDAQTDRPRDRQTNIITFVLIPEEEETMAPTVKLEKK